MDKALYERDRSDQEMIVLKDPPLGGHLPFSVKQFHVPLMSIVLRLTVHYFNRMDRGTFKVCPHVTKFSPKTTDPSIQPL